MYYDEGEFDERSLILEIQKYNILYNVHHPRYWEKKERGKAWAKISTKLGVTSSECSTTWSKLRSTFTSYLTKRQVQRLKNPDTVLRPWRWEREMAFVVPFLKGELTSDDLVPGILTDDGIETEDSRTRTPGEEGLEYAASVPSEPEIRVIEEIDSKPVFHSAPDAAVEMMELTTASHGHHREESVQHSHHHHHQPAGVDEVDMFYLSIAKTAKKLPAVEQAKLRMTICNIVCEAEIRQTEVNNYYKHPGSRLAITSMGNYYNN